MDGNQQLKSVSPFVSRRLFLIGGGASILGVPLFRKVDHIIERLRQETIIGTVSCLMAATSHLVSGSGMASS